MFKKFKSNAYYLTLKERDYLAALALARACFFSVAAKVLTTSRPR
jgi:hypothetical protein